MKRAVSVSVSPGHDPPGCLHSDVWLVGSRLPAQVIQQVDGDPLFLLRCASRNASSNPSNHLRREIYRYIGQVQYVRKYRGPAGIHLLVRRTHCSQDELDNQDARH